MSTNVIVSYDGTANEDDAIALGRVFGSAGAEVSLAYVRHAHEPDVNRERAVYFHPTKTMYIEGMTPQASKDYLADLVARMIRGGFTLLDTQFATEHLAQFGAIEVRPIWPM